LDILEGLDDIKDGRVVDEEVFAWMKSWGTDRELEPHKIKHENWIFNSCKKMTCIV
jgi:hypothetical protein